MFYKGNQTSDWNLCGLHSFGVGQSNALPEVGEQVSGQSGPGGSWSYAVGDFAVFEGDELHVCHIVDDEGRTLLCGFKENRQAAVGDKFDVQAENEVFGVTQRQGHAFRGLYSGGRKYI